MTNTDTDITYPFKTLAENAFFAQFTHLKQQYKVLLLLEDSDWSRPIVFGCDRFSELIHTKSNHEKKNLLIQYLMQVTDPSLAFFIINKFIQNCSGTPAAAAVEVNLLEEFRIIGFDKVIEVNDSLSRLKLKIGHEMTLTVMILPSSIEYGFDLYPCVPVVKFFDLSKGFLGRVLNTAQARYRQLNEIRDIFLLIDSKYPTLEPERSSPSQFKRKIYLGMEKDSVEIYFDLLEDKFVLEGFVFKINEMEALHDRLSIFVNMNEGSAAVVECGICYSDYLEGQVVNLKCPNSSCKHSYHEACLREWFTSNPECKAIFNRISGKCLFCEHVMQIEIKN